SYSSARALYSTHFSFSCLALTRLLHSFPTRRSSDLAYTSLSLPRTASSTIFGQVSSASPRATASAWRAPPSRRRTRLGRRSSRTDRKSTRLNSSHGSNSYAVFGLKKKERHARTNAHD